MGRGRRLQTPLIVHPTLSLVNFVTRPNTLSESESSVAMHCLLMHLWQQSDEPCAWPAGLKTGSARSRGCMQEQANSLDVSVEAVVHACFRLVAMGTWLGIPRPLAGLARPSEAVRNFTPSWFTVVMSCGIVGYLIGDFCDKAPRRRCLSNGRILPPPLPPPAACRHHPQASFRMTPLLSWRSAGPSGGSL